MFTEPRQQSVFRYMKSVSLDPIRICDNSYQQNDNQSCAFFSSKSAEDGIELGEAW